MTAELAQQPSLGAPADRGPRIRPRERAADVWPGPRQPRRPPAGPMAGRPSCLRGAPRRHVDGATATSPPSPASTPSRSATTSPPKVPQRLACPPLRWSVSAEFRWPEPDRPTPRVIVLAAEGVTRFDDKGRADGSTLDPVDLATLIGVETSRGGEQAKATNSGSGCSSTPTSSVEVRDAVRRLLERLAQHAAARCRGAPARRPAASHSAPDGDGDAGLGPSSPPPGCSRSSSSTCSRGPPSTTRPYGTN